MKIGYGGQCRKHYGNPSWVMIRKLEVLLWLRKASPRPLSVMSVLNRRIKLPVAAMARVIALHKKATTTLIQKMDCHVATLLAMTKRYMTRWIDTSLHALQ